ncbi:MAG: hypothetical protein NT121_10950 [Chloroflexi bacterium]|nr:hypothetical protein [Chloroflexota bacterium]
MPKIFYTERDIDDLYARGVTCLDVHDGVVLTDLARERMFKYGMTPNRVDPKKHVEDDHQEVLIHKIKAAVLARLNGQVDAAVLDSVIRRVVASMK